MNSAAKMLKRFSFTVTVLLKLLFFGLCAGAYILIMGDNIASLLRPTRTSGIVLAAFTLTYIFMTKVYGGMEIGVKKSKPIIYTMLVTLLFTDLSANLFLSIMASSPLHDGRFVFESPLHLLAVYGVQVLISVLMAYFGNWAFFKLHPAASCLIITKPGTDLEELTATVGSYRKQYRHIHAIYYDNPDLEEEILGAEAVFFYELSPEERTPGVLFAYRKKRDIYYSLELPDIVALRGRQMNFGDKSFIASPETYMTFEQRCIKRAMDILLSTLGLVILSPILLLTALAIKLEDGGSIFYRQERATFGGRVFKVIKFRSMREDKGNEHRSVTTDDDRITRVGRLIRKFRIDELPQLINILKSDMSLVGPRPEMLENVEKYTAELPEFVYRLRAKAGLTGMAQIYGKYNTTPKDKLMLDLSYIEQFSIWLDLKLLFQTVLVFFTPDDSTAAFKAEKPEEKEETHE